MEPLNVGRRSTATCRSSRSEPAGWRASPLRALVSTDGSADGKEILQRKLNPADWAYDDVPKQALRNHRRNAGGPGWRSRTAPRTPRRGRVGARRRACWHRLAEYMLAPTVALA